MEMQVFQNDEFGTVRTALIDGEPWFSGKDVAEILGYANPQKALRDHVDDDDRTVNESFTVNGTMGALINESGLYSLILRSRLPKSHGFKRWVTSEVLPAIRRHGMYAADELLSNPDLAIAALTQLKAERERRMALEASSAEQSRMLAELQPKAAYCDLILQSASTVPITQIAKDYGMSGHRLNELLHSLGVQFRFRDTWLLYSRYASRGYTQSRTYSIDPKKTATHTYWTQKGRLFLYGLLKSEGILPLIEIEAEGQEDTRQDAGNEKPKDD